MTGNNISENQIKHLFENAPVGIFTVNSNFLVESVNQSAFEFGLFDFHSKNELIGKDIFNLPIFQSSEIKKELEFFKEGIPFEIEISSQKASDNSKIVVVIKGTPITIENEFMGGIIIIEDFRTASKTTPEKVIQSDLFNNLISSISDYFLVTDIYGNIKYSLPSHMLRSKFQAKETNEKTLFDLFTDLNSHIIEQTLVEIVKDKKQRTIELPQKEPFLGGDFNLTLIPIVEKSAKIKYFFILFKDQSEEREKFANLKSEIQELKAYRNITSAIVDAVIRLNLDGNITFWNESAVQLFGFTRSEVFGKFIGNVLPEIDKIYFQQLLENLKSSNTFEAQLKIKSNDSTKIINLRISKTNDDNNSLVALCSDITDKVVLEGELRRSEESFRNIVTNTREFICTFTVEGNINYVNPYFVKEFGYTEDEMLNLNLINFIDLDKMNEDLPDIQKIIEEQNEAIELPLLKKNNEQVYVLANFTAVSDFDGNVRYYTAVFTDITEKKNAENDYLMIRSVFQTSHDGITVQKNREYTLVNESFVKMFGYDSMDEILGKDPLDFVSNNDIHKVAKYIEDREKGEESPDTYIFNGIKKNGSTIVVEKSLKSFSSAKEYYVVASYRDITEQQNFLTALANSEKKYRSISENINDSAWTAKLVDNKIKQVFYTSAIEKITGYKSEEFIENSKLWIKIIHPDDKKEVIRKTLLAYKDKLRKNEEIEFRIVDKSGNIVWVKNKLNLIRNDKGELEKIYGLVSDITLSKQSEEKIRKSTEDLQALNESKDRFISIVSHDLRSPFSSILGFTDLLLSERDLPEEKQVQYINFIQDSAKNMLSLVNSLLDYTRLQTGRIEFIAEKINANGIIQKAFQMLTGAAMRKKIDLVSEVGNDLFVHADSNLLLQVFNNLVSNAIKFTNEEGQITISAKPLIDKKQIEFSVSDTGIGISNEDIGKLFTVESKHTTTGTAGETGSGLGLSLCKEIVEKHGGDISVESEYQVGTTFKFTIPVSSTRILLVDDSSNDRILYSKLLKSMIPGYEIDTAANGVEAFEKIKTNSPALVITDHQMPEMTGQELVKKVLVSEMTYKPPIIVLSSDLNTNIIEDYNQLGIEYVFNKPVGLATFKTAIEKSLQKAFVN
ncbi:MAG: PAS domain S-box protein [Bacteroidota bacterium]